MSEWTPYRIQIPKESAPSSSDGQLLETVYHVVHVRMARRILEDGHLRAGLIYDESKLQKSRICVTWLSANTWALGSIYGNVQFAFPWNDRICKRRCYWVEAMTGYRPHAYRILLTDRDLSGSKHVREYDPESNRGPLLLRDGNWYWNNQFTSEFLIEDDVDLEDCTGFDFVSHHSSICRLNGGSCSDFTRTRSSVGGRVMAFLLGHGLHSVDHVLKQRSRFDRQRRLSDAVDTGIDGIRHALGKKKDRFGGGIKSEASRQAVVHGALALYGSGNTTAARALLELLKSADVFEEALAEIVNGHFGMTRWTLPE
jgi:hypothetical protein